VKSFYLIHLTGELEPGFEFLCRITSDLSPLLGALQKHTKGKKKKATIFYSIDYAMCLRVGGTELMAYIEWTEKVRFFKQVFARKSAQHTILLGCYQALRGSNYCERS